MKIHLKGARVTIHAHYHMEGSALKGTLNGTCEGFDIDLAIESDEDQEKLAKLVKVAHQSCFTEDALERPVKLNRTHSLNGQPFEVGIPPKY